MLDEHPVLPPSNACSDRKEAEIQSVLRHVNIVETIAFSVGDRVSPPCLIVERMHMSLFARLKSKIDFPTSLGIVLDVCKVSKPCLDV